jgi:hypothetical protein
MTENSYVWTSADEERLKAQIAYLDKTWKPSVIPKCRHNRPKESCTTCHYGPLKEPDEPHIIDLCEEINRNHARWKRNPQYFETQIQRIPPE